MRAIRVLPAGTWAAALACDSVTLDFDHRHRRRIALSTDGGAALLLDLAETAHLREGDGLATETGEILRVRARPEALIEIAAPDAISLARIAWHLGNRHLPVQVLPDALRIRHDHVIAGMIVALGGTAREIAAAFDPEPGAYAGGGGHHHGE